MKIGIIGHGYVGQAIASAHSHHDLVIRDPRLPNSADLHEFLDCDGIFVCVPSPSTEDGSCDSSILEQVLKDLLFVHINRQIPIICKTTAPPSTYSKLLDRYPNIVHCPEFLTAKDHIRDYENSDFFILGGHDPWCIRAREIIREGVPRVSEKFLFTDIKSAAFYKYMTNCYLAMKVTFMNDFKDLADAENIDWKKIKDLSVFDDRIGYTHMDVPGPDGKYGWGGACFPKDVSAIIMEALDKNLDFELMQRVETLNKKHRSKNDQSF